LFLQIQDVISFLNAYLTTLHLWQNKNFEAEEHIQRTLSNNVIGFKSNFYFAGCFGLLGFFSPGSNDEN